MTQHPVLVPTSAGLLGGVVTAPAGEPVAAAFLLGGLTSLRAGVNRTQPEIAAGLATLGIVTLRADAPGLAESHQADLRSRLEGTKELLAWFRERTGPVPLLLVATCYGMIPAADLADEFDVAGVAVLTPPFFPELVAPRAPTAPAARVALSRRVVFKLRRVVKARRMVKKLPLLLRMRRRHGAFTKFERHFTFDPVRALERLRGRTSVWLLTGGPDPATPFLRTLSVDERCSVEIVEDLALRSFPSPGAQRESVERTVAWARAQVGAAEPVPA